MITVRKSHERGHADHGWLNSYHTFSFADYYDPRYLGSASLRVLNDDRVAPGKGFAPHSHRDMEIISYVLEGALAHKDSMGNGAVIRPGDVQRMSAGTGVTHSEYNPSPDEPVHFLQIWIVPEQTAIRPDYEQKHFSNADKQGRLRLIASPDGSDGAVTIHQDVCVYATTLAAGETVAHRLRSGRKAYVHLARGVATVNGVELSSGDGISIVDESELRLASVREAELLLFDLA